MLMAMAFKMFDVKTPYHEIAFGRLFVVSGDLYLKTEGGPVGLHPAPELFKERVAKRDDAYVCDGVVEWQPAALGGVETHQTVTPGTLYSIGGRWFLGVKPPRELGPGNLLVDVKNGGFMNMRPPFDAAPAVGWSLRRASNWEDVFAYAPLS